MGSEEKAAVSYTFLSPDSIVNSVGSTFGLTRLSALSCQEKEIDVVVDGEVEVEGGVGGMDAEVGAEEDEVEETQPLHHRLRGQEPV